ncbi:hypothetical protein P3F89_09240 [Bacillus tropicus]|uniref:Uncharacterized protein n=1 Tax=Bacillus tropicus TaxID=2026188 RepID=A0ABD7ZVS0_9BACI|nr:hypothetical protein [Bacillus tropicus]WMY17205.1 hypothetical protein P3F89_09240 [Bacillus tropicus]
MATKSFTSEFKFNKKSGFKLANAIENSRKVEHTINKSVSTIVKKEDINNIMDRFFGRV